MCKRGEAESLAAVGEPTTTLDLELNHGRPANLFAFLFVSL